MDRQSRAPYTPVTLAGLGQKHDSHGRQDRSFNQQEREQTLKQPHIGSFI